MLTPNDFNEAAEQLVATVHILARQGWCPATGGNFSTRADVDVFLITQSGRDKTELTVNDLMVCDFHGEPADPSLQPSAETAVHLALYNLDPEIGAVLHTHSIANTLLSRNTAGDSLTAQGFEMQKALSGILTHEIPVRIPIFDNTQDMTELAEQVRRAQDNDWLRYHGLLVRGHGLYAWGRDLAEARRHVEGLEFLFACLWQEKLLEARQ